MGIARKWWRFVDKSAPVEVAKLQLLVAAILHAKASEDSVHTSMHKLRTWALQKSSSSRDVALTAQKLAAASVDELIPHLSGIHRHRSKAGRVIAAAKSLIASYGSRVPSDRTSLLRLPGVGPKLANVLVFLLGEEGQQMRQAVGTQ